MSLLFQNTAIQKKKNSPFKNHTEDINKCSVDLCGPENDAGSDEYYLGFSSSSVSSLLQMISKIRDQSHKSCQEYQITHEALDIL